MQPILHGLAVLLALGLSLGLPAQSPAPFSRTGDLFVCDPTNDGVWRCQDLNQDGDYLDAGEVISFYSDAVGPIALQNDNGVVVGPDGTVFISDSGSDVVVSLRDVNGDGDANDAGEALIFFDGTLGGTGNASGIELGSSANLSIDDQGVMWVATANTNTTGLDGIIRLQDTNGDGDANDAGESLVYAQFAIGGALGDSIPQDVIPGPNGDLYYVETGSTGVLAKGVYRLHDDVVPDGQIQIPGEVSPYFVPVGLAGNPFYWALSIDAQGVMWIADSGNEILWRLEDVNSDLVIANGTSEAIMAWTSPSSLIWKAVPASDGSIYALESQTPDRILRFAETGTPDGDFMDPGEVTVVYDDTIAPVDIANPRSCAFARAPTLAAPATISVNSPWTLTLDAVRDQAFFLWVSDIPVMIPAPPFGTLGILVAPPATAAQVLVATVPSTGRFALPIPPAGPGIPLGFTAHIQVLTGPAARLELSNTVSVTFTP